jgi:hypothetical protein
MFRPVRREELIDDILTPIYKAARTQQDKPSISPHKLAVLFTVFALGAFMDLTLPPCNVESKNYFTLARAALSLRPILDCPDVSTVQAIVLMASFHTFSTSQYTLNSAWSLISLGSKIAQGVRPFIRSRSLSLISRHLFSLVSVCVNDFFVVPLLRFSSLDRDSARWNLDPKTVQRRRSLFWELFSKDLFCVRSSRARRRHLLICQQSIALGRPPSISSSYLDCEVPEDDEQSFDEHGHPLPSCS